MWLDDLSRELLASGEFQSLIVSRHVVGVMTNPTIFASALAKGDRYDRQLRDLAERGASTETAIFTVTTDDDLRSRLATCCIASRGCPPSSLFEHARPLPIG